ncbi:MAG: zf-HC2 domain-containing protein [Anaerolineales bacterium]|jgi:hypothetical protein
MNCREVLPRINAYLDEEVSPSEKKLLQAHLATCQSCRQELESLNHLQNTLRQQLQSRAAQAAPSPQAWSLVQAALPADISKGPNPKKGSRPFSRLNLPFFGNLTFQKVGLAFLILLALVATIPTVSAKVQSWVGTWFSFSSPDGKDFSAIGGFTAFTPYHATVLPKGFTNSGIGTVTGWPDYEALELTYDRRGGQFFTLLESKGGEAQGLPSGEDVSIGESPAVFIPTFATSSAELVSKKPGLSIVTEFDYSQTNLLTWFMGEVRIEMFSNLSKAEMVKIAESLVPMQTSKGEQPSPPD